MNRFTLNGVGINSGALALVLASAAISGSASLYAAGIRGVDALSPTSSSADVIAAPTVYRYVHCDIENSSQVYVVGEHQQAAEVTVSGYAEVLTTVFRTVEAVAEAHGSVDIHAIVANKLGYVDAIAGSDVSPDATRIQAGLSNSPGSASVTIYSEPEVTRYVLADISGGTAEVRAEYGVNNNYESFADFNGNANIDVVDVGIVTRQALGNISGTANTEVRGTRVSNTQATLLSESVLLLAEAYVENVGAVTAMCSADMSATAVRNALGVVDIQAKALASAGPVQIHAPKANIVSAPVVTANAQVIRYVNTDIVCSVHTVADSLRTCVGEVQIHNSVSISDSANQFSALVYAEAAAQVGIHIEAVGDVEMYGTASIIGSVSMYVDTIANPEVYDPPRRTFYRKAHVTEFHRAAVQTDFRRAE